MSLNWLSQFGGQLQTHRPNLMGRGGSSFSSALKTNETPPPRDGATARLVDKDHIPGPQQHLSARRQTALLLATRGKVMRFQKAVVCTFALLFTSLAFAQTSQLKRVPDVPYVPT